MSATSPPKLANAPSDDDYELEAPMPAPVLPPISAPPLRAAEERRHKPTLDEVMSESRSTRRFMGQIVLVSLLGGLATIAVGFVALAFVIEGKAWLQAALGAAALLFTGSWLTALGFRELVRLPPGTGSVWRRLRRHLWGVPIVLAALCLRFFFLSGPGEIPEVLAPFYELNTENTPSYCTDVRHGVVDASAIKRLDLGGRDTTDDRLAQLAPKLRELPNLNSVRLNGTQVTDAGLDALTGLESLEALDLSNNDITDEGIEKLANFKNLTWVGLRGTRATENGIAKLRSQLPDATIIE